MKYDLVFEGGGAKGMAFVGSVAELLKAGHTHDRLLGTSAGAITATLLAAGYTVDEMNAALMEQEDGKPVFSGFMGRPEDFTDAEIEQGGWQLTPASAEHVFEGQGEWSKLTTWISLGRSIDIKRIPDDPSMN